jgi:hypothetical protein
LNKQNVLLQVIAEVNEGKEKEFVLALKSFAKLSHFSEAEGHLLYQSLDADNTFCFMRYLDSKDEMDVYLHSNSFQYFMGAIKVLCKSVDGKIVDIKGVETVRQLY